MLVLITYDVNTETVAGRSRLQSNVQITVKEYRILFLNAIWMQLNVGR